MTRFGRRLAPLAVLALAWLLRVAGLDRLPGGLAVDEAHNGLDAFRVLGGYHPIFFLTDNGREPIFIYTAAPLVGILGPTPLAIRLASAFWGVVVVALTFGAAHALARHHRLAVALASASAVAVAFFAVAASRVGVESMVLPATVSLLVLAYVRHQRQPSLAHALAMGVAAAACAYAHPAGRLAVLLPLVDQLAAWPMRQDQSRRWTRRALGAYLLAWGATIAPLAAFFVRLPAAFWSRLDRAAALHAGASGAVSADLSRIMSNSVSAAAMYVFRGDNQWSQNIGGQPLFQGLFALGWLVGVGLVAAWFLGLGRRSLLTAGETRLILVWTLLMMLPAVLSGSGRDFARAGGALPAAGIVAGLGIVQILDWMRLDRRFIVPLILGVAGVSAVAIGRLYLSYSQTTPVSTIFSAERTEQGRWLAELAESSDVYATSGLYDRGVIRFLSAGRNVRPFDAAAGLQVSASAGRPTTFVAPGDGEDAEQLILLRQLWLPRARTETVSRPGGAHLIQRLTVEEPLVLPPGFMRVSQSLGEGVVLDAFRVNKPTADGLPLALDLAWRPEGPLSRSLTVFVHLRDSAGKTVAQADGLPAGGLALTSGWPAGGWVLDRHSFALKAPLPAGRYAFAVGLYDQDTGERLASANGATETVLGGDGTGLELP